MQPDEILRSSASFKDLENKINEYYPESKFKINSVHYLQEPYDCFKLFVSSEDSLFLGFNREHLLVLNPHVLILYNPSIPLIANKFQEELQLARNILERALKLKDREELERSFEIQAIKSEKESLLERLKFLEQKENLISREIEYRVNQFIKGDTLLLDSPEIHCIKFLTENPALSTLQSILPSQGNSNGTEHTS